MSKSVYGLPLALGQTLRQSKSSTLPPHGNGLPDYLLLLWENGLLKIYAILNSIEEINTEGAPMNVRSFMDVKINNIKGNVPMIKAVDGRVVISKDELQGFGSVMGKYDMRAESVDNVMLNMLTSLIMNSIDIKILDFKQKNNISEYNTSSLEEKCKIGIIDSIVKTAPIFSDIFREYVDIDVSMYTNLIGSIYGAIDNIVLTEIKNNKRVAINPMDRLNTIDAPFANRIQSNSKLEVDIATMIGRAEESISSNSFVQDLIDITLYGQEKFKDSFDKEKFVSILTGTIGGVVNLALMFSVLSSGQKGSSSSIFLQFAVPKKFNLLP